MNEKILSLWHNKILFNFFFQYQMFSDPELQEDEDPGVECRKNAAFNFPVCQVFQYTHPVL